MAGLHVLTNVGGETRLAGIDLKTYELGFEKTLHPELVHQEYGDKRSLKKNGGTSVEYTRLERLVPSSAPTPMTEGSPGSLRTMTETVITATPNQYGEYIKLTDRLVKQGKPGFFKEAYRKLALLGGETFDIIHRNGIIAGSKVAYAGGKTATNEIDSTCLPTLAFFRKGKQYLEALDNKGFENGLVVAIVHTDTANELMNDPEWQEKTKFQDPSKFTKGEIGTVDGIKFVKTTHSYIKAGQGSANNITGIKQTSVEGTPKADVYCSILLGEREAYGVIGLDGEDTPQTIYKDLGSAGTNDPMNQIATLAYVGYTVSKIIEDKKMYRLEHACSA